MIGEICYVYLDDIIIFSESIEEHEGRVKQVFDRLKKNGLQIKIKKCEFIKESIKFLGHKISYGKVEMSQHLVEAIADAELPNAPVAWIYGFSQLLSQIYKRLCKDRVTTKLTSRQHRESGNAL